MATPDRAKSDWIALLETANAKRADKIPPGYMTHEELRQKFGKSSSAITRNLPILLESGVLTVCNYKRVDRAGRLVEMPHYKLKK
jgi:predicted HTH transcriptional regulator